MQRHRIPRAAGAASSAGADRARRRHLPDGRRRDRRAVVGDQGGTPRRVDKIQGWVNDPGADGTSGATQSAKSGATDAGRTLIQGLANGIKGLTSLIFFVTFSGLRDFFLLKDGPSVRNFIDRNLGVPAEVATVITGNVIQSLRRYFLGVTIVAAFNAVVIGLGGDHPRSAAGRDHRRRRLRHRLRAVHRRVRLRGVRCVADALLAGNDDPALIMLVMVILGNGLLQNIVQPIAFGATLDLNPLVVLIVTIGFGSIFGMVGLVLAAPLTSAALHITRELAEAKAAEAERAPPPESEPAPAA